MQGETNRMSRRSINLNTGFVIALTVISGAAGAGMPRYYAIPTIDLSAETARQVIVDREAGQYLGHPATVLLENGRTMLCVYPKGHGKGAIVLKRSEDGGLTWSERLPTPENWATSMETPTIHRVIDAQGVKRLIVFSGLYPIRMAVSEDDGTTWSPLVPIGDFGGIVAMSSVERLVNGDYAAFFHDDGRFLRKDGVEGPFVVYKTVSKDGGLTWGPAQEILRHPEAHLCEPGVIRSPDGKQLAMLLRENSRKLNSFVSFSDDEGATWSEPRELPGSLTGDRHVGKYAPDGRLLIVFRDKTLISPTTGDWVGWVGSYDDLVQGRAGEYRIRLMDNTEGGDCAYPGLELLPDGTFVTATYGHWMKGEEPYIAGVRFTLAELDAKLEQSGPEQTVAFQRGTGGYHTFRIPSIVCLPSGTLLAFCEGRKNNANDHGDIDLVMKRSEDGGRTWGPVDLVHEEGGTEKITIGNPCPVFDEETGVLWLPFCRNNERVFVTGSSDEGKSWSEPVEITDSVKRPEWTWVATGPGVGILLRHGAHEGRLVIPCDHRETVQGVDTQLSHCFFSDDHGKTWQCGESAGLHTDECQVIELDDGRLMINMRNYWGKHNEGGQHANIRATAISEDGGATWSASRYDPVLIEPICQASFLELGGKGVLFSNPADRDKRVRMTVRSSEDEGQTWPHARVLHEGPTAYSCLTLFPDGTAGCLYERGAEHPYEQIVFARFTREWLRK